jgi:hypothetical protein
MNPARSCSTFIATLILAMTVVAGVQGDARGAEQGGTAAPGGDASETDAPQNVPSLGLSQSQRQTVYQSISNQQSKKDTAPLGFRPAVGAHVPDSIKLEPLPKTLVELMPQLKDYEYAFVANQVLIVEPQSKTVVEVID